MKFLKGTNYKTPGGKKNMKKLGILGLMAILMALMALGVNAADPTCTFDQTATTAGTSSTYIRGASQNLSITITNPGEGAGNNCTKCVISVSSGTITGALTFNTSDGTNNTYCNTTVNTLALPDDSSLTYTMTMYNESQDSIGTACTRAFTTDNTVPISTLSSPADKSEDTDGEVTFTYTCTNATSAILYVEGTLYTMTESSDSCTYTGIWPSNGFHSHYAITSDGLNTTTSSTSTVNVNRPGGGAAKKKTTAGVGAQAVAGGGGGIAGISFTTIAVIAVIWYAMSDQKKGRKKKR